MCFYLFNILQMQRLRRKAVWVKYLVKWTCSRIQVPANIKSLWKVNSIIINKNQNFYIDRYLFRKNNCILTKTMLLDDRCNIYFLNYYTKLYIEKKYIEVVPFYISPNLLTNFLKSKLLNYTDYPIKYIFLFKINRILILHSLFQW